MFGETWGRMLSQATEWPYLYEELWPRTVEFELGGPE